MRMTHAAKDFFQGLKKSSKQSEPPPIFDTGIGDWILDFAVLALIALVVGTIIRWAYLAIVR
jgi:hypothetical protein